MYSTYSTLAAIAFFIWAVIGWCKWYRCRSEADRWSESYGALMKYAIGVEDDLHEAEKLNGNLAQRNALYEAQAEMVEPPDSYPDVEEYGFESCDSSVVNTRVPMWGPCGLN